MSKIKQSEARILIYLSVVPDVNKKLTTIAAKLNMDYGFCIRVLNEMAVKGWVAKKKYGRYMNYINTQNAPVELAKKWYNGVPFNTTLEDINEDD
jgi:hypothetical protein